MGFFDSIKGALGSQSRDELTRAEPPAAGEPRHADRTARAESIADGEQVTGGKHALRD